MNKISLQSKEVTNLVEAILLLQNTTEARKFLRDLLTEGEMIDFAFRWKAAQLLEREVSYSQIKKETGLSVATIARISKWLSQGQGGYKLLIERIRQAPSSGEQYKR